VQHIDWHLEAGFAVVFVELPVQVRQTIHPPDEWFQLCPLFDEFERNQEANNRAGVDTNADGQPTLGSLGFIALWLFLGLVVGAVLVGGLMVMWHRRRMPPSTDHHAVPSTELIATDATNEDAPADSEGQQQQQQREETEEKHCRSTLFSSLQK